MPTELILRVSVSMAMIFCLYLLRSLPRKYSSYSMAPNEQYFESLNDESLNTNVNDLSLNKKKRKGKEVSETVRPGKAGNWSDAKVDRSIGLGKPTWCGFPNTNKFLENR